MKKSPAASPSHIPLFPPSSLLVPDAEGSRGAARRQRPAAGQRPVTAKPSLLPRAGPGPSSGPAGGSATAATAWHRHRSCHTAHQAHRGSPPCSVSATSARAPGTTHRPCHRPPKAAAAAAGRGALALAAKGAWASGAAPGYCRPSPSWAAPAVTPGRGGERGGRWREGRWPRVGQRLSERPVSVTAAVWSRPGWAHGRSERECERLIPADGRRAAR